MSLVFTSQVSALGKFGGSALEGHGEAQEYNVPGAALVGISEMLWCIKVLDFYQDLTINNNLAYIFFMVSTVCVYIEEAGSEIQGKGELKILIYQ